jgi:hypothetical protein
MYPRLFPQGRRNLPQVMPLEPSAALRLLMRAWLFVLL